MLGTCLHAAKANPMYVQVMLRQVVRRMTTGTASSRLTAADAYLKYSDGFTFLAYMGPIGVALVGVDQLCTWIQLSRMSTSERDLDKIKLKMDSMPSKWDLDRIERKIDKLEFKVDQLTKMFNMMGRVGKTVELEETEEEA